MVKGNKVARKVCMVNVNGCVRKCVFGEACWLVGWVRKVYLGKPNGTGEGRGQDIRPGVGMVH